MKRIPDMATFPVKCTVGGKHNPRTVEGKDDHGTPIKYDLCRKCYLRTSGIR